MKNICCITLGKATWAYSKFYYPAGEMQVRLTSDGVLAVCNASEIRVTAYIQNADDIMELAQLKSALAMSSARKHLALPYLPYSRADRRFVDGDCLGLVTFMKVILSQGWSSIRSLDTHNEEAAEKFGNGYFTNVEPGYFHNLAIVTFAGTRDHLTVVLPDAGAAERYCIPSVVGNNTKSIYTLKVNAEKVRDSVTGKLSGFRVPKVPDTSPILIIDDICDGGGTFIGIADKLRESGFNGRLGLYVTHGIFSKGLTLLRTKFDRIYTTDSMPQSQNLAWEEAHVFQALNTIWEVNHEQTTVA